MSRGLTFDDLKGYDNIYLYAGDMPANRRKFLPFIGLSLNKSDKFHINHDIRNELRLGDNTVDIFQSEDVMEHIEYELLPGIFNDIYRVLKRGGLFRLSIPDYQCDILWNRSLKDGEGNIVFDKDGGGKYVDGKVVNGGHVWFPWYGSVKELISLTDFSKDMNKINFLHYYDERGKGVMNEIDYTKGYISRTPDNDDRLMDNRRPMSIVVDMYK